MKYICAKDINFCSAHRLVGYEGPCANLHGHNYSITCFAKLKNEGVDDRGFVLDYKVLKNTIKSWLDLNWDHNLIIYSKDSELIEFSHILGQNKKPFILPMNTTSENLAGYLLGFIFPELFKDSNIEIYKIEIHESSTSFACVEI